MDEKSIVFSVNQTLVPDAQLNTFNEALCFTTYNAIIFTNYNTTETTANSTTITNVIWMDSLPEAIIAEDLFMLGTLDTASPGIIAVASTIGLIGACQVVYKKRKKNEWGSNANKMYKLWRDE